MLRMTDYLSIYSIMESEVRGGRMGKNSVTEVDETPVFIFIPISNLRSSLHPFKLKKQKSNCPNFVTYYCSHEGRLRMRETKNAAHCKSEGADLIPQQLFTYSFIAASIMPFHA